MSFSVIQHYNSVKALKKPQTEKTLTGSGCMNKGKLPTSSALSDLHPAPDFCEKRHCLHYGVYASEITCRLCDRKCSMYSLLCVCRKLLMSVSYHGFIASKYAGNALIIVLPVSNIRSRDRARRTGHDKQSEAKPN